MKKFWNFIRNEDVGELSLYGDISDTTWWGDEITPKQFQEDLNALGDVSTLNIYINSGGGDVFAGQTIYSILKRHSAHKVVHVDGLAASIASIIAMAGDEVIMPKNAMMMIHNAWTVASGNKDDLRAMADTLEKIDGVLRDVYVAKTGREAEEVEEKMNNETWFTADEALEFGLIDSVGEELKAAASLDNKFLDRYHNIPNDIINDEVEIVDEEIEPCNGEVTQPVEDITSEEETLRAQRKWHNDIRKKILERK